MRIAVCNPDNLGDLLLRQPMFAALRQAGHQLLLVVRDFVAPLARDLFPDAEIAIAPGNPYTRNYTLDSTLGRELIGRVQHFAPDLFVVAAYQYTSLDQLLAAALPHVDTIGFSGHLYQPFASVTSPSTLNFFSRVAVPVDMPEAQKNELLCGTILGRPVSLPPPVLQASAEGRQLADARLRRLGLRETAYWVVCAGDGPPQGLRNWEIEKWIDLCRRLIDEYGLRILFIGTEGEHESTSAIQTGLGRAATFTATITDQTVTISELVSLIDGTEGYIGKDTGPMHFAAALGKPVVAVFGGGNWPRFVPQARTGAALTVDMPCQGCYWFCRLEHSYCVKAIPVAAVFEAASAAIRGAGGAFATKLLPRDPQSDARIYRELYESAQESHRNLELERAKFSQWHEDRVRDIAQLRTEVDAVRADLDRLPSLELENARLQAQLATARAEVDHLSAQIHEYQSRRESSPDGETETDRTVSLEAEIAELRHQLQLSQQRSERALELEREVESLLSRLAAETADKDRLSIAHLEQALLTTQLRAEIDSIESRHLGRIADLEKALAQEKRQTEFGLALVPDLRDELLEAHAENTALRDAVRDFAASVGRPDQPMGELFAEAVDLHHAVRRFASSIDRPDQPTAALLAAAATLHEAVRHFAAALGHRDEPGPALFTEAAARLQSAESDIKEISNRLRGYLDADAAQAGWRENLTRLEQDRQQRLAIIHQLTASLEAVEKDRADRGAQIDALHNHIANLDRERRNLETAIGFRILRALRLL
jgi:ADP-heptose:LPS heptosyltransferase